MPPPSEPFALPVYVLCRDLAARRLSPVDLVGACLARIERLEPSLHAFVEVYADSARLAAEAADKAIRSGHAIGPLHGVPIALKDLVELEGRVVTGGSPEWRERRSGRTATLARRLIAAGMIVVGKTHTVQFAFGGWGTNQYMGTPLNPWDPARPRTPGGSSSGSGVAVAARLVPWAIGTDTGGSVRMPASFCGITGLKTTIGRISTYGVLPLSPTLDTPGPITRSVEDAAVLLTVLQGADPLDPLTRGHELSAPLPELKRGVKGLRLARMQDADRDGVDAEVLAAYDASLATFAELGAEIVDFPLPGWFADIGALNGRIMAAESYALLGHLTENPELRIDAAVRPRIQAGARMSARDYLAALAERDGLKQSYGRAFADVDALLTPTTRVTAVPLDEVDQNVTPAHFTRFANCLDLCALAVPNGSDGRGLPTSLQIICRGYDEATALRIGWAYEDATDWHDRAPPI